MLHERNIYHPNQQMDYDYYMMPVEEKGTMLDKLKFAAKIIALLTEPFLIFQAVLLPIALLVLLKFLVIGKSMLFGMALAHLFMSKKSKGHYKSSPDSYIPSFYSPQVYPNVPSASFNIFDDDDEEDDDWFRRTNNDVVQLFNKEF
jgi:hypothetical protein